MSSGLSNWIYALLETCCKEVGGVPGLETWRELFHNGGGPSGSQH